MDERWAWYWVNKYRWALEARGDVDQDDLLQAARIGIWEAERTYKPEAGEWSTYSAFWIRREIRRALGVKSGKLPPPEIHLDEPLTEDAEETRLDMMPNSKFHSIKKNIGGGCWAILNGLKPKENLMSTIPARLFRRSGNL